MSETGPILLLAGNDQRAKVVSDCLDRLGISTTSKPNGQGELVAIVAVLGREVDAARVQAAVSQHAARNAALFVWLDEEGSQGLEVASAISADAFACADATPSEIYARIRNLLHHTHVRRQLWQKERDAKLALELTRTLVSSLEFREILFTVVRRIAEVVKLDRVSIVLIPYEEPGVGYVIAASDDHGVSNLRLDLAKYPEIERVVQTRDVLTINDVTTHPVLDGVRDNVTDLSALSLIPISSDDRVIGVLFLRTTKPNRPLTPAEVDVCTLIANASVPALRNAQLVHRIREEKQEAHAMHVLAEARMRAEQHVSAELRKSKEFLESLIDASVDAIVAADLHGTLVIYNKGAERIYGYPPQDVIGKMHVRRLYPDGVAKEVMRRIRSDEYGGPGRLQSMHSAAVDAHGNVIPISLSAALIYSRGEPIATVGIFTDLREKLQAEERLAQVQKKLEVTEKQALLAELAGTAAHELNQPLTSVMGYGELLIRRLAAGTPERNAAQVIMQEAERMADLVRKIGKITRYETKSYVGDQRILDLDRATDESAKKTD